MAKRKRSQTPPTNLPSGPQTYTLPSEAPTATLPDELLDIIVRIACQASAEGLKSPGIDIKTTHSFTLVSKPMYNLMVPYLYMHVRLTRPSDLLLYARTVSMQPSLATYTKTLWIGPDETHVESPDCWPLNKDCTAIRSSITEPMDLPSGVQVGVWWFFAAEHSETDPWIEQAARDIIREACRTVGNTRLRPGVRLQSGGKLSRDGKKLRPTEGCRRVYDVQQLLDAFLVGVRKQQDSCQLHQCSSSTPLRTYATYDRFDHPAVYDRSEAASIDARDGWVSAQRAAAFNDLDYDMQIYEDSDRSYAWDESSDSDQDECLNGLVLHLFSLSGKEYNLNLAKVIRGEVASGKPTMGSLILLSRLILARSENLLCLALTSYLQLAACGNSFGPKLDQLHLLMVGPPARRYQRPLSLNHKGLKSVRRLRVWESAPSEAVFETVENSTALPALESLECTWSAPWDNDFDKEFWRLDGIPTDAASASSILLECMDIRLSQRLTKPMRLTVWTHHTRLDESDTFDLEDIMDDPDLKLKILPWDVAEFKDCEHYQRPRALARVRKQWERECQEVLALPPEKLVVRSIETPKKCREVSVDFYEGLQVIEEGDSDGPL